MAKILYLEDEESLAQYLPLILKEKKLDVVATSSIEEAIKKLASEDFDAVLLDIMMPPADDMDAEMMDYGRGTGIEVARRMKKVRPKTPIVAFTVITDTKLLNEMRQAGIISIVNKPAEVDQIVNCLAQVIQHSS